MPVRSALQSIQGDYHYTNVTGDGLIKGGQGILGGIIVCTHTTGTIKLYDNTAASGTVILDTYTYAAGSQVINLFGLAFGVGLFADVTNTQSIIIAYN